MTAFMTAQAPRAFGDDRAREETHPELRAWVTIRPGTVNTRNRNLLGPHGQQVGRERQPLERLQYVVSQQRAPQPGGIRSEPAAVSVSVARAGSSWNGSNGFGVVVRCLHGAA